mmetsp:Transcript_3032/g.9331  ORF Transcript_3032/g.9331 Transcript_3032/m.9331 type:complete len:327 (+) Transcript_3032:435-1415(+)
MREKYRCNTRTTTITGPRRPDVNGASPGPPKVRSRTSDYLPRLSSERRSLIGRRTASRSPAAARPRSASCSRRRSTTASRRSRARTGTSMATRPSPWSPSRGRLRGARRRPPRRRASSSSSARQRPRQGRVAGTGKFTRALACMRCWAPGETSGARRWSTRHGSFWIPKGRASSSWQRSLTRTTRHAILAYVKMAKLMNGKRKGRKKRCGCGASATRDSTARATSRGASSRRITPSAPRTTTRPSSGGSTCGLPGRRSPSSALPIPLPLARCGHARGSSGSSTRSGRKKTGTLTTATTTNTSTPRHTRLARTWPSSSACLTLTSVM